jgi:hypothetical protein
MASKKGNKKTQVVEAVAPAPVQAETLPKKEEEKPQPEQKAKKLEEPAAPQEEKDEEVVDKKVFYPMRGSFRGRGGNRGAHSHSVNRESRSNRDEEGSDRHGPSQRGRGGSFRGRGDSGPSKPVTPWHRVISHKSEEAWSHFLAKTQGSEIKHYLVTVSKVKGEPRYAHPQEDEISSEYCFSVGGRKGGEIYLVRGREYYISLAPGSSALSLNFTKSCVSGKNPFSWLPSLQAGQTLHVRVNAAFPNSLYYQDAKERFVGGLIVVARNFNFKKDRKKESEECESEEESSATQYDE